MSTPFAGEIRIYAITYAPKYWALCNGQTLPITQNQALFALLGVTFGGDGVSTFGLPNLQGSAPVGVSGTLALGATGGEASHTLVPGEIPSHSHTMMVSSAAGLGTPAPAPTKAVAPAVAVQASGPSTPINNFGTGEVTLGFASDAVGNNAGGQGHENRQPFLALNYCIALKGSYPPRQ